MAKKREQEDTPPAVEPDEAPAPASTRKGGANIFTYVGGGEDSPRVIDFMGKQRFVRGQATEVTDPEVLKKIKGVPTFVDGEVDEEELHEYDLKAKAETDARRKADKKLQASVDKAQRRWAMGEE